MAVVFNRQDAQRILNLIDSQGGGPSEVLLRQREAWLPFSNGAGETCPAYGVVAITGLTMYQQYYVLSGVKPESTHKVFAFNGPAEVAAGGTGQCTLGPIVVAATIAAASNGQRHGVTGWELDPEGDPIIQAIAYGPISDDAALVNVNNIRHGLFEVAMTQTGGSQGTASAAPTWTYTIDDVDGNELATAHNPTTGGYWVRHLGQMAAATRGIASFSGAGALKILWCNEQMIAEECT